MSIVTARRSTTARLSLVEALNLGSTVWDELLARSGTGGPFMTWAWHRAWAEGAEADEVESARVVVLRSAAGELEALFPFRVHRTRFRRVPVTALGWAIGDLGCPDHLDLPALGDGNVETLVRHLERLPCDVILLGNGAEGAPNTDRLCAACARRGWAWRRGPLWRS